MNLNPFRRTTEDERRPRRPRALSLVDQDSFVDGYPFSDIFGYGGLFTGTLVGDKEQIGQEFLSYVLQAFRANPIVYALAVNRINVFAEARFQFRERTDGRPGRVFGTEELQRLERPWPNGSTRQLLALAEVHNACAGNFFAARLPDRSGLRPMRPDWTWLVLGSEQASPDGEDVGPLDLRAEVIGYLYNDGGPGHGDPIILPPDQVVHYKPIPDPLLPFRGLSWMTPIIEEILADKATTSHKRKYMQAGATPNLAIKLNVDDATEFKEWVDAFKAEREESGLDVNPYKTLFLAATADPVPIGAHLKNLDLTNVQSAGEVRMAAAAGVNPVVAGLWAGLQGSALNAGNFEAAFRQFIDGTIRPLWTEAASAFGNVLTIPSGSSSSSSVELWMDDRDIPALREDAKKAADIAAQDATTLSTLVMNGWDPDAAVEYIQTRDPAVLTGQHSGLPSVQLQPGPPPSTNGANGHSRPALTV